MFERANEKASIRVKANGVVLPYEHKYLTVNREGFWPFYKEKCCENEFPLRVCVCVIFDEMLKFFLMQVLIHQVVSSHGKYISILQIIRIGLEQMFNLLQVIDSI